MQQDGIDDCEDGCVRTDSERQGRDCHGGEPEIGAHHTQSVPHITDKNSHVAGNETASRKVAKCGLRVARAGQDRAS